MPIDRFTNRRQCSAKQVSVFVLESVVVGCKGRCLHGSSGSAAGTCTGLGQGLLVQVGSLRAPGQVGLHLPELGQVKRGDLLGLLDLLLVRLDLALELVNETLHPLVVLPVLVLLVSQLLDVSLGPTEGLLGVSAPPVLRIHLGLKLANSGFHLGHSLLASLQCVLLSFVASVLGVLHLGFQKLLVPLQGHGSLLLHAQLICKAGSINHGALSFLLRKMSLSGHLVQVLAHGSHLLLALHLGPADRLVGASLVAQALICVCKFLLHHATVAISLFQQGPCLLQGVLVCICTTVGRNKVVRGNGLGAALLLKPLLDVPDVALDQTDVALALRVGSIGVLKGNSKVDDVRVQLLLHTESLHLALGLCLQGHLHAFDGLTKVLSGRGKFLLLLGNPPLNFLLDLGKLEGSTEDLVLLLLKGSFGFRECSLKLHLLGLQPLPDFVDLVDGASTLADLVHDVLNLVGEELVLPTYFLELQDRLIIGILDAEQFG